MLSPSQAPQHPGLAARELNPVKSQPFPACPPHQLLLGFSSSFRVTKKLPGREMGGKRGSRKCGASLIPPVPSASPGSGITCLFPVAENKSNKSRKAGEGTRQGVKSTGGHPAPSRRAGTRTTFLLLLLRLLDFLNFFFLSGYLMVFPFSGECGIALCARLCWCGGVCTYTAGFFRLHRYSVLSTIQNICCIKILFSPLEKNYSRHHRPCPSLGWSCSREDQKNPPGWEGWG